MNRKNIRVGFLIVVFFLSIFLLNPDISSAPEEKQITVIFRFDDYSSLSSTDIELKIIDVFQKYKICCTFGVIPYRCTGGRYNICVPLTPMKANILKNAIKAGVLEVALHGYSHRTIRESVNGEYTEFFGLDYNSQVEKIAKGKGLLEKMLGIRVTTFIPPWNSYDLNTINALEKLGFKYISAGKQGIVKDSSTLKFLPATCGLTQLRDAVESARRIPDIPYVIIVLFHQFDFLEIDRERGKLKIPDFVELLAWITSQKDIHVRSFEQTIELLQKSI